MRPVRTCVPLLPNRKSEIENRKWALTCLVVAATVLFLALTHDAVAQSNTAYGRAAKLADEGKLKEGDVELTKGLGNKRSVDISATVFVVSDKLVSKLGPDVQRYMFPEPTAQGAVRVPISSQGEDETKWSLQVTPRSEEQISVLNDTVRQDRDGAIASIFGMRVSDMQQVQIQLVPDRKFPSIGPDGKPETEMVREKGEFVTTTKFVTRTIPITIRPVIADNGSEVWLRFFDKSRPFDPYPPTSLTQSISWSIPSKQKLVLGPPEYEFSAQKANDVDCVKVPSTRHLMVSGIMAIGGERVREGIPILDMIPVVGEEVFSSKKTVHYKISVYIILDVSPGR
ncbi:MAG: hypothetical protein AB1696_24915 [Planctomycetota bacterium]